MRQTIQPDALTSDIQLAQSVVEGDEAALTVLYEHYADPLFAFIYHHLDAPRSDVEEIWSETWLAALRSIKSYRGQSRLFTWLCSLARHKIADYCRKQRRHAQIFSTVPTEVIEATMDDSPLPERILADRAVRARVVETLMALPDDYRTALVAQYANEQSVGQIAQQLGKSYKATESLLSRARAAFRAAYEAEEL